MYIKWGCILLYDSPLTGFIALIYCKISVVLFLMRHYFLWLFLVDGETCTDEMNSDDQDNKDNVVTKSTGTNYLLLFCVSQASKI